MGFIATAHAAEGISVKLAPYIVGDIGSFPVTATLLTSWLAMVVLIMGAFLLTRRLQSVPGKAQSVAEVVIGGAFQYVEDTLESKELARKYFPVLMTIFLSLVTMNWLGLLPGVTSIGYYVDGSLVPFFYPPAADLNIALAYALVAVLLIQVAGVLALGAWKYGSKFINFSSPLSFVIGLIELVSEVGRIISFAFRLFGNIFAGKVLITVAIFFAPLFVPVPILAFEVFVGFIQAVVFAFLSLIFIKLAVAEHH